MNVMFVIKLFVILVLCKGTCVTFISSLIVLLYHIHLHYGPNESNEHYYFPLSKLFLCLLLLHPLKLVNPHKNSHIFKDDDDSDDDDDHTMHHHQHATTTINSRVSASAAASSATRSTHVIDFKSKRRGNHHQNRFFSAGAKSSSIATTTTTTTRRTRRTRTRTRRRTNATTDANEPPSSGKESNNNVMPWEQNELEKMKNVKYSQPRPATKKKIESDKEYELLKTELKTLTLKYGAGLTLYCLLGYGIASSFSSAIGVIGSYVYLQFLSEYVDTVNEERDGYKEEDYTRNLVYEPVTDVKKLVFGPESVLGKIATIYSRALFQKRLIVPVVVVASESLWNHIPGHPFDFNYGVTLIGFLTYKASALTVTYGTLKPLLQEDAKNAGNWEPEEEEEEEEGVK